MFSNYSPKNANTVKMSYSNHVILMKLCSLMIWSVILRNNYIKSLFIFSLLFLFCKSCFSYNFVYNSSVPHVTYVLSDNKLTWRHVTIFFLLKHLANFIRNYATCFRCPILHFLKSIPLKTTVRKGNEKNIIIKYNYSAV